MLLDSSNELIPSWKSPEFIKLVVGSIVVLAVASAVIYLAIKDPSNYVKELTTLFGGGIGYFLGKHDNPN